MDNTIKAKKHLGQNFLRNKNILAAIVWKNDLHEKHVIEIGPGPGDLTEMILMKNPMSLALIEIDGDMLPLLEQRFAWKNITIYYHDVLGIDINCWVPKEQAWITITKEKNIQYPSYSVYGNIPYYITSPILRHFLYDVSLSPETLIVTMQKEVAERILARDGKHSVLSLSCWLVSDVEKICDISPNNFVPAPKVWSTCLQFTLKKNNNTKMKKILALVEKGFAHKRKKLLSNLCQKFPKENLSQAFRELSIHENARAEDLSQSQWVDLANILGL